MAPICVLLHSLPWLRTYLAVLSLTDKRRQRFWRKRILWAICIYMSLPGAREESDNGPEPEVVALGLPSWK